ncbi:MAG: glycerol-3-phosphate 1-O-acyltransferase [Acidimicrobiia bacterium]
MEARDRDTQHPEVFLLDASSSFERDLLAREAERRQGESAAEALTIASSRRRRKRRHRTTQLEARARSDDNPAFVPLRVVWLAPERHGRRSFRVSDFLRFGDIRDPDPVRARWLYARRPELVRIVDGASATAAELKDRWAASGERIALGDYVERQAHLALERAEREVRGARYKVPRFIHEEVLAQPSLAEELSRLAEGNDVASVRKQATGYLREIAALPNTYVIDVAVSLVRWLYRRGYRDLHYNEEVFAQLSRLASEHPLVFLPSHQSNLDHLILSYLLWDNELPPNHTAGGVNLSFFPVGPLLRRTGVFFIRRSFRENPVYKATLRAYLDYLIEKRFPLEWYLEGGRSRSGKLREPRYGMLSYVADSLRRRRSEDIYLVPVSIAYDQIQDVGAHAAEQRGEPKEKESASWLVRAVRSLHGRFGSIYVRFGEPLSMAKELSRDPDPADRVLETQKLAFEVMVQIQRVTPITEPALVVSALLSNGTRARTAAQLQSDVAELDTYARIRQLPLAPFFDLGGWEQVAGVLELLAGRGLIATFNEGPEAVYRIHPKRHHEAAYYRNTIVHHFVAGAVSEVALLAGSHAEGDPEDRLQEAVLAWRDLLKFEFFFPEKSAFWEEVRAELEIGMPGWANAIGEGGRATEQLLSDSVPIRAHWVLRPWIDGYFVTATKLTQERAAIDEEAFIRNCLGLGRQYLLQGRIASPESVSRVVFEGAMMLAANRGLLDREKGLTDRRKAFADEVNRAQGRLRVIDEIARRQRAGL